jgi:two-component system sensor histidine kinase/response regulator
VINRPAPSGSARGPRSFAAGDDRFERIFRYSIDAIAIVSLATGRYLDVNDEFVRMCGLARERIVGSTPQELGFWSTSDVHDELAQKLARDGEVRNHETAVTVAGGESRNVLISAVLINWGDERCMLRIARDITEFRRSQENLRRSDRRLHDVLANAPIAVTVTDAKGIVMLSQGAGLVPLAVAENELAGRSIFEILTRGDSVARHWREALDGKAQSVTDEIGGRVFEAWYSPVRGSGGEIAGAMSVATDVTERVRAEEKLRRKEAFYRSLIETSADAVLAMDASMTLRFAGGSGPRELGYSADEILHRSALDFVHPDNLAEQSQATRRAFENPGEVVRSEARVRARDGTWIPVEFAGQASQGPDGQPMLVTTMRNITERKSRQEAFRRSEEYFRTLIESSSDLIIAMNADGIIIFAGGKGRSELGFESAEEMVGHSAAEFEHPEDIPEQIDLVRWVFNNPGVGVRTRVRLLCKNGESIPFEFAGRVITGPDDQPILATTGRSIAERMRIEAELSAARDAALEASRAKSEFVSSVSHEIRTPMNAILGMADVLWETSLSTEQRRHLETIISNGNSLLELINTVLDFAKIESGRLTLESVAFDLAEVVEHVGQTFAVRAHEKGLELLVRVAPEVPAGAIGDPLRLRQVLFNLVGNAIKFTEHGEVLIDVRPASDGGADAGALHFSVSDSGIGIAPDKLAEIFTAFTQVDSSTTRRFGGSGLGLSIVERLASLMGGRVWAESEPGKGSIFHFTVRLPASAAKSAPIPDLKGTSVIILDDNARSGALLAEMLAPTGATVAAYCSPVRAIAEIARGTALGRAIDAILVNQKMPDSDGLEIARQIKRKFTPPPRVIILTGADSLPARMMKLRAEEIGGHLVKPVRRRDLYTALGGAAGAQVEGGPAPKVRSSARAPRMIGRELRILLADDSADNRNLVQAYLKHTPYRIEFAENGEIAFRKYVESGADLILMDIQMPVLDGYGAVEMIRRWEADNQRTRTPIVALTASAMHESITRALDVGCDLHISKPVKRVTLLDAIASMIEDAATAAS